MNRKQRMKIKQILHTITVFMIVLMTVTTMVVHAADTSITLTVEQTFTSTSAWSADTFVYRLVPLDHNNPMPPNSDAQGYSFTISGNANKVIGPMQYDQQGAYLYELSQIAEVKNPGYTYDGRKYTIEIHVDESLNVIILVKNELGKKEDAIVFNNTYETGDYWVDPPKPKPTDPIESPEPEEPVEPPAVTDSPDITYPSNPDPNLNINDGRTPGEGYELYDPPDRGDRIDIDDWDTPGEDQDPVDTIPRTGVDGPKTGDESNATLYIILFASGSLLVAGATLFLLIGKKRKRSCD